MGGAMLLSANLGFLFTDLPLDRAVHAAKAAGFDAVEFHDQVQQCDLPALQLALKATGLPVISLNCHMGPSMGRAAISTLDFARDFEAALHAAQAVEAGAIHVLAGRIGPEGAATFSQSLALALEMTDRPLVIEPISRKAVADYHLWDPEVALALVRHFAHPNLRILADWYHLAHSLGVDGALEWLDRNAALIGHLQIARLSDRGEPWPLEIRHWPRLRQLSPAVGLEYRPTGGDIPALLAALRA